MVELLNDNQIRRMREVGNLAARILAQIGEHVASGQTTHELDSVAKALMAKYKVRSSQFGYNGFSRHICTSVNHVVCHGVPGKTERLKPGDIVNVDLTIEKNGYHGDTSKTFPVGTVSPDAMRLVDACSQALAAGIGTVMDGARVGDIGAAVSAVAARHGVSVVREYCGHGIGRQMHMAPQIPHVGIRGRGLRLRAGMAFTIEPMLNLGSETTRLREDGWTVETRDGALSAQFEHTVVVQESGCQILTAL